MPRLLRTALATAAALAAVAPAAAQATSLVVRLEPRVVATPRDGVRLIDDLRVGPLGSARAVSTLADVREQWGRERTLKRRTCTAGWGTGVRLLFTSFGGPSSCAERFLQVAYITGPAWSVKVGRAIYAIGTPRSDLPAGARRIRGWNGGGYELATMPFLGGSERTTTVMAHMNGRQRVDRFVLFIGAAGD